MYVRMFFTLLYIYQSNRKQNKTKHISIELEFNFKQIVSISLLSASQIEFLCMRCDTCISIVVAICFCHRFAFTFLISLTIDFEVVCMCKWCLFCSDSVTIYNVCTIMMYTKLFDAIAQSVFYRRIVHQAYLWLVCKVLFFCTHLAQTLITECVCVCVCILSFRHQKN